MDENYKHLGPILGNIFQVQLGYVIYYLAAAVGTRPLVVLYDLGPIPKYKVEFHFTALTFKD